MGKLLIICGVILIIAGLIFQWSGKIPWLGRLPGDIKVQRENFTFYFPLATSIIISIIVSLLLFFINKSRS